MKSALDPINLHMGGKMGASGEDMQLTVTTPTPSTLEQTIEAGKEGIHN